MRTRDIDKQQRIKDSMVRLILQEGLAGTSVAKIAREAGVSPATIYVYYESKEAMLTEVFRECARQSYDYLQARILPEMDGAALISAIVHGYYTYTVEHEEVFSFVEQCARCPSVAEDFAEEDCCCGIFDTIHEYQARGQLQEYSDANIAAVLFAPVKHIAASRSCCRTDVDGQLAELVGMLQKLLVLP